MQKNHLLLLPLLLVACNGKGDTSETTDTDDTTDSSGYAFAEESVDAFVRVDRLGMPAVSTALIVSKDDYNAADPSDDAALTFAGELLGSLGAIHSALDDDLAVFGLTPCTVVGDGTGSCAAQGVPLIVPDTLKLDLDADSGFPSGRLLTDPVVDVTLAVVLLDLSVHAATTFVGLLNPTENDAAFSADFPYLAAPN